jgi:asparagine synthase (glutamine-hydrolysing)
MSRIAGWIGFDVNPASVAEALARGRMQSIPWSTARMALPSGTFLWTGTPTPHTTIRGPIRCVIDGTFYNFPAASPSEKFIELYMQHGIERSLQEINGDFAGALYDERDQSLIIFRDRFGLRPLYYVNHHQKFAFASRPAALLLLPGVACKPNRSFVARFAGSHYRTFDTLPTESPYEGIAQLETAHYIRVRSGSVSSHAYWHLTDEPDFTGSPNDLAAQYQELLIDAVDIRFRSAKNPAFTLSGGMDSSSVLASAVQRTQRKQHAFSSVYQDKTYDESDEIRSMLAKTVQEWHQVLIEVPNLFTTITQLIEAHDEPVATATWLSHFEVCRAAANAGFSGLFGGLGGDELNAGEYEHYLYFFADLKAAKDNERLGQEIDRWASYHDHPLYRKNAQIVEKNFQRLVDFNVSGRCLPDRERLLRYQKAVNPDFFKLDDFEPPMDHPFRSYLKNRTYQDMTRETVPCCLRAEDRQSIAWGLNLYLPFFDHRLVEFMFRVPSQMKYEAGVSKHLLRLAMRGILPEETRTRVKKTGWNAPAHHWFSGKGRNDLLDLVHSRTFQERGIYNIPEVLRLIDEHNAIVTQGTLQENHMMFLWQLVNLELWLRNLPAT